MQKYAYWNRFIILISSKYCKNLSFLFRTSTVQARKCGTRAHCKYFNTTGTNDESRTGHTDIHVEWNTNWFAGVKICHLQYVSLYTYLEGEQLFTQPTSAGWSLSEQAHRLLNRTKKLLRIIRSVLPNKSGRSNRRGIVWFANEDTRAHINFMPRRGGLPWKVSVNSVWNMQRQVPRSIKRALHK